MNKIQETITWESEYEKSWFCDTDKIIHKNIKDYLRCNHCISKQDREEYEELKLKQFYSWFNVKDLSLEVILKSYNIGVEFFKPWAGKN